MTEEEMLLLATAMGHGVDCQHWPIAIRLEKDGWFVAHRRQHEDFWRLWRRVDGQLGWHESTIEEVIEVLENPP